MYATSGHTLCKLDKGTTKVILVLMIQYLSAIKITYYAAKATIAYNMHVHTKQTISTFISMMPKCHIFMYTDHHKYDETPMTL